MHKTRGVISWGNVMVYLGDEIVQNTKATIYMKTVATNNTNDLISIKKVEIKEMNMK